MTSYAYNVGIAFARIASTASARTAIRFPSGADASYAELNRLANRLAAVLLERGLRRRDVIGIVHTKSIACYAAMLAALKIGAAYVNLDDQNPPARLKHILDTAKPAIVVGETIPELLRAAFDAAGATPIDMSDDSFRAAVDAAPASEPEGMSLVTGSDPAYIMYTSGSTGVPKGAMMTHANILNFGAWTGARFGITENDVLTNVNPMYFDNSVFDFYGSMLNGAALAPVARETLAEPAEVLAQVERAGATIWFSVPSLLIYLTTMKLLQPQRLPSIRAFVFGGEGYPKQELRRLFATYGSRSRLINVYGPTECTCICSAWDVTERDLADDEGLVTLGPIAENFSMLVLDGDRAVEPGGVGELCLLGPQVGLGYANDPERTAAAFRPNPLHDRWREIMYRTGDLVRLGPDGRRLDFVGRKDNQIKHMGYRIELEEIEAALNGIDGIAQSAVLQKTGRRGQKVLVAYVAASDGANESGLREKLQGFLPPYMIPQRFEIHPSLPKNANGKVDRVALAALELS